MATRTGLAVTIGKLWIRTVNRSPQVSVYCRLGRTEPKVVEGYAGWTLVPRYRRRALVEWAGSNPLLVEIPFMIDYWDDVGDGESGEGEKCEAKIRAIERMAGLDKDQPEPPLLHWNANAPHDNAEAPHLYWVIEGLEWGPALRHPTSGNRVRQEGTLTLRQWEADEFLSTGASQIRKNKKGGKKGGKYEIYTVKKDETLSEIAKRKLGKASRWKEIAKLNNIRDPRKLKENQKIKIPKK